MDTDQAIELLGNMYMRAQFTDEYGNFIDTTPYEEAIDMAIDALEKGRPMKEEDRKALIKAIETFKKADRCADPDVPCADCENCEYRTTHEDNVQARKIAIRGLTRLLNEDVL